MAVVAPPVTDQRTCANCRQPAVWYFDAETHQFQLFDAEPRPTGSHVIHPESGKALRIPINQWDYWEAQPVEKWTLHRHTCGVGAGPVHVGAALTRMARGDTRRSRQRPPLERAAAGPRLTPNGRCENCDGDVAWVTTEQDGQRVPLDLDTHTSGLVTVIRDADGRMTGRIEGFGSRTGLPRYRSHHLSCGAPPSPGSIRRTARVAVSPPLAPRQPSTR